MRMEASYLFLFALLVANVTSGAAQNTSQFHHFWLVQVWPHGYCIEVECARRSRIFVLHGLWPVNSRGQTLQGTNKSDPTILASVLPTPVFFWPIVDFLSLFYLCTYFSLRSNCI